MAASKPAAKPASTPKQPKAAKQRVCKGKIPEKEHQRRVDECRALLERHLTKSEIKKAITAKYDVDGRTVERYLSRARDLIVLEISETRDYFRSQSLAVYRSVLKNPDATLKEKILAQRQIDHLLGLHSPWKVAQTDTNGRDIPPDEARDRLSSLASRVAERIREAGVGGNVAGDGAGPSPAKSRRGKAAATK
jgi:hypothetical protein